MLLEAQCLRCLRHDEALFEPVDLRIATGELLVVEGRNGAGKTTLLRALLGLAQLAADRLQFHGADVLTDRYPLCAGTVWIGHLLGLKGDLSVRENLALALAMNDQPMIADAESLFAELGLAGYEDTPTRALSAGQRKRAALARLAASTRPLWLLDEPFANLDAEGMALVERLLGRHLERGGGAVFTSHGVLPITTPARSVHLVALA